MTKKISIAILGAGGYTGAELLRLLLTHPHAQIKILTGDTQAGKSVGEVYPHLRGFDLPSLIRHEQADFSAIDVVFCCLPHGTTQPIIAALPEKIKIIDLSADFRLSDPAVYAQWYGHAHQAVDLQKEAVYGLTELAREDVKKARLVANPGCYPTSAQLPLIPLLEANAMAAEGIIINSVSGVSGSGRAVKQANLFCETHDGMSAYGIASHRHAPEIEQGLSNACGKNVMVTFTPHLAPFSRGILSTIYVQFSEKHTAADVRKILEKQYAGEPFVKILPEGLSPSTHEVRGTNDCHIGVFDDRVAGRAIIISAIDNLCKGASGQAVQNMNAMFGFEETLGLPRVAVFP